MDPIISVVDLCERLMPHEITQLNNGGRIERDEYKAHYWTDDYGEHLDIVYNEEIPQPE